LQEDLRFPDFIYLGLSSTSSLEIKGTTILNPSNQIKTDDQSERKIEQNLVLKPIIKNTVIYYYYLLYFCREIF